MREEYNFSNAKRAKDVLHLKKLQQEGQGKTSTILLLDTELIEKIKAKAKQQGMEYHALINQSLEKLVADG
jgi:predicted DNA binding CopG/RHH family protein